MEHGELRSDSICSKGCGPDANCSAGMKAGWLTLQRERALNPITPHETRWCHENVRKAHSIRFPILHHLISDPISSNSTDESVMDQILHPIPSVPCHQMASGWLSSWSPTNWAASRPPRRARPRSSGRRRAAFYGCAWKGRMDSCCRWGMLISPGKNVDLTIEIPMNNEDPMDFTGIDGDFTRKHWDLSPNFHPWMVVFFFIGI